MMHRGTVLEGLQSGIREMEGSEGRERCGGPDRAFPSSAYRSRTSVLPARPRQEIRSV